MFYLQYYSTLPKALTKEETAKLFEEYNKTHCPKIKEELFYGSMRLVRSATKKYVEAFSKYDTYDDYYHTFLLYLYDKWIDDYAQKLLEGDNHKFSTHVYRNVFGNLGHIKKKSETYLDVHSVSIDEIAAESEGYDEFYSGKSNFERPEYARERDIHIDLNFIEYKYFKFLTDFEAFAITEYYLEGLTLQEIAETKGVTLEWARQAIVHAEEVLKFCCKQGEPTFIKPPRLLQIPFCQELISKYLKCLDGREQFVARKYFVENQAVAEIAKDLKVSGTRVYIVLTRATKKLFDFQNQAKLEQ